MKQKYIFILFILFIITIGVVIFFNQSTKYSATSETNNGESTKETSETQTVSILEFDPSEVALSEGEAKEVSLQMKFANGSADEKLNYLKTTVTFSPQYVAVPEGVYVDTSVSGFDKIFRVDGPIVANQTGKIVIELGMKSPETGPTTDGMITVAVFTIKGIARTSGIQVFTLENTQIVNNNAQIISSESVNGIYQVN